MDAAVTFLKRNALFFLTALLVAMPASAQLTVDFATVNLTGATPSVPVHVSSASGSAVSFTIAKGANDAFYTIDQTTGSVQGATPFVFYIAVANTACSNGGSACHGTVTITPTGGTPIQIAVTFTPGSGSGGGSGAISFTPSSVALNTFLGGIQSSSVSVATTNGSTINNCSIATDQTWLTTSPTSMNLSGTAQSLIVYGNASSNLVQNNSQNTGHVTVCSGTSSASSFTVTLNVGTVTTSYSANPSSVALQYPTSASAPTVTITSNSANVTSFTGSVSTDNGGSWLLLNNTNQAFTMSISPSVNLTVSVNASVAATLTTGTYTGHVIITNPGNLTDQLSIPVSLAVNGGGGSSVIVINPSPATVSAQIGNYAVGTVSVSTSNSSSQSCQMSSDSSWLQPYPASMTITGTAQTLYLYVYAYASYGISDNHSYNGRMTVTCGSISNSFNVTMNVGNSSGGGGTGNGVAAPTSLSFAAQTGQAAPQHQGISVSPSGSFTATASVGSSSQQWLKVGGAATLNGTGPGLIDVSADPTGLSAGVTYQGTITVSTAAGSQTVAVTFLVSASPVVQAIPGGVNYVWQPGDGSLQQTFQLVASDGSSQAVTLTPQQSWITVTPSSGNTPMGFLLSIPNPSSLCNGLNTGTIKLSASGAANSTDTIPVTVLVSNSSNSSCSSSGGGGSLTLGATSLTFNANVGGSAPAAQTLGVSASSQTLFTVQYSTTSGGNWLSVSQNGGIIGSGSNLYTNANLSVSANPSGLSAGTYNGQIVLTANGVSQTVSVSLVVGGASITVSPTSVNFTPAAGGSAVFQDVTITPSGSSAVSFTVTTSMTNGSGWLSVSANGSAVASGSSLSTSQVSKITINVNPAGLSPSTTYQGTVTLTPSGGTAIPISVTVTTPAASISAAPSAGGSSLTFSYRVGDNAPNAQTITVSGTAGLTFSASAQTQGNGTWLTVSPLAGTTPGTVSVTVSPSGLNPGQYTGSVTIAGTGSATGSNTIPVTLNITAPLPTITSIGNAASYVGGAIAPGEVITIFGTGLGPTPAANSPTVDTSGKVTTTLGGVQVTINGFQCPMIYASATQISAVVPYEVARFLSATILVQFLGQTSNGISAAVTSTAPGIFTANASGTGPGAILNANLSQNAPGNPAKAGDTVAIYMTGEGQTAPAGVTGKVTTVASSAPLTPQPLLPVAVTIDGQPAQVAFYGEAPGIVSGVMQVNVVIPPGTTPGDKALTVKVGTNQSQAGVTVSVR